MTAASNTLRALEERARWRREQRERRAAEIRGRVEAELRSLLPAGGRAWLIGSLAWGGFGERSDVDLVIQGVDAGRLVDIERAVARAAGAEVDVLDLSGLPADFRARVLAEGVEIHGR